MSIETSTPPSPINYEDCWSVPRSRLTGIPARLAIISAQGASVELHNTRPLFGSFTSWRHELASSPQDLRQRSLMNMIKEGDGHLGRFERSDEYTQHMYDSSVRPGDSPERAATKALELAAIKARRAEDFALQLSRLNEMAAEEQRLYVAFDLEDNPLPNRYAALGRLVGFVHPDEHGSTVLPVVEGQNGEQGTLPSGYREAWPYLQV
jgi:hypothetical protein